MEAPVPKNPSQSKIPESINCKFDYQPSIRLANLVIEIEQGAHLPDEWQKLISNLAKEGFSLSIQEKAMFEMLLKSAPTSPETNSAINVGAYLEKRAVVIRYLARAIKSWNVPAQNLNYVERFQNEVNLIEQIKGHFVEKQTYLVLTALHGLGGIGKTQLAIAYVWKHRQDYQGVYWFSSDTRERLMNDYITFGQELKLYGEEDKQMSKEERAKRVKTWLENRKDGQWLIVLDNPEKRDAIKDLLPTQGGHILITSRHTEWPGSRLAINVFSETEAHAFAKKILGEVKVAQELDELNELIILLGKLPLALAQAYAYISKNGIQIKDYLVLYQEMRNELLSENLLPAGDEHEVITITWNVTLRKMKEECPDSVELLYGCTHLHHEAIPDQLVRELITDPQTILSPALLKNKALKARRTAQEYSMINFDEEEQTFSIHSLVQQIVRDQLIKRNKVFAYLFSTMKVLKKTYPYNKEQMVDYKLKKILKLHLEKALKCTDQYLALLTLINKEETRKLAVQLQKDILLDLLIYLADAYNVFGDVLKCKESLELILLIKKVHYGEEHVEVAGTLRNLAKIYGDLGNAREQKVLLANALKIFEAHYGKEHINVAETYESLSNAYEDAQKQKAMLEIVLKIKEAHYGKEHVEVAMTLNNLANAYGELGDFNKQSVLLEQALKIFEKNYGQEHVKVAVILNNLASAYNKLYNVLKCKELLVRALKIKEAHYGSSHVEIAKILNNLANAYENLRDYIKQKESLERALPIMEAYYGKEHSNVAIVLDNLANAYENLRDYIKQKESLERALPIMEAYYGKENSRVEKTLHALAINYSNLGDYNKEKELLIRVLEIKVLHYGKEHVEVAKILFNLGIANMQQEKLSDAISIIQNAYNIFAKSPSCGINHPYTKKAEKVLDEINQKLRIPQKENLSGNLFRGIFSKPTSNQMNARLDEVIKKYKLSDGSQANLEKGLRNAAVQNNVEDIEIFIEVGCDINAQDNGTLKRTALHWAVVKKAKESIRKLLELRARCNITDASDKSAYDYANEIKDSEILVLIEPYLNMVSKKL